MKFNIKEITGGEWELRKHFIPGEK